MLIWRKLLTFAILRASIVVSATTLKSFTSVALPLENIFDNQAASSDGSANFDGRGGSFDSQFLPMGPWVHDGVKASLVLSYNMVRHSTDHLMGIIV